MSRNYVVLAAILLAVFADCGLPTHAAEKDAKEQSSLTFKGKVLLLIIDRSSALEKKSDTEYLSDAVFKSLATDTSLPAPLIAGRMMQQKTGTIGARAHKSASPGRRFSSTTFFPPSAWTK